MNLSTDTIEAFQNKILNWYQQNKRDLPWRNTTNPYFIHVSEIMLQQTQVERVKKYYETFLNKYPNLETLAEAQTPELLATWQGLGFNNRVLRLREATKQILQNYKGRYPQQLKQLTSLPGVGEYTASAILAFAFNIEAPVVDTNIRRVLIYELNLDENISIKKLQEIALQITPKGKARQWNNALMDYSSLITTASKTQIKSQGTQGKFEGSTRQVRSTIVKELLKNNSITKQSIKEQFPQHNIEKILNSLEKDNIIKTQNRRIYLKQN